MAVTLSLFAGAGAQFFDNNGNVLSGGKIYTYFAGTTTPLATYTSNNGSAFHTNPIILDSAGRVPSGGEIWLQLGIGYKFVLKTSTDVLIATYDNIPSSAQPPAVNDADSILYEQGYTVTAGSFVVGKIYRIASIGTTNFTLIGAVNNIVGTHFIATGVGTGTGTAELSQTVETKLRETVSVKDFGAVGDGIADDSLAFHDLVLWLEARGGGATVTFPQGTYLIKWDYDLWGPSNGYINNCDGIRFIGENATIKIMDGARVGNFAPGQSRDEAYGFVFVDCTNTVVENFYLDGNLPNLNIGPLADGNALGIGLIGNCSNTIIRNVTTYAFGTDGLFCRADGGKGILYENCKSDSNRRQGISITAGEHITMINCQLLNTGAILGTAPQSGCDIEPQSGRFVSDCTFINCLFKGNGFTQVVMDSGLDFVDRVHFIDCVFDNRGDTQIGQRAIWCKEPTAVFTNCQTFGSIVHGYGTYNNCDIYHDDTTGVGQYALENANTAVGSLTRFYGGSITTTQNTKPFSLQGVSSSPEEDRKVIDGTQISIDGTSYTSGTFWAIARGCVVKNLNVILKGTLPASPFYLNQTDAAIESCTSNSPSLVFGATSASGVTQAPGIALNRFLQPTRLEDITQTIVSGVISVGSSYVPVNTEGNAATDDLDTINGGLLYQRLIVKASNSARTVVVKHGTGNILLDGSADKTLDNANDMLELFYDGANWLQLSFSSNGT
jgi:hypothetical protein